MCDWICIESNFCDTGWSYWLDVVDHFVNDFNLIAIGFVECLALGWVFGADKIRDLSQQ